MHFKIELYRLLFAYLEFDERMEVYPAVIPGVTTNQKLFQRTANCMWAVQYADCLLCKSHRSSITASPAALWTVTVAEGTVH